MAEISTNSSGAKGPPNWFVKLCKWLWKKQGFVWVTLVLGITLNAFASLLFIQWPWTSSKSLDGTIIGWFIQNPGTIVVVGLFLILLILIVYLGSRFDPVVVVPDTKAREVVVDVEILAERRYLQRMIRETENLTLKGIPAGLMAQGVPLDEVFIPLEFRPNRPPSEYPLTEEERRIYRDLSQRGALSEEMERILFEAEKGYQQLLKRIDRISIADLWQCLTRNSPTAVIQGVPGIGKSTLMERLTLHMARCGLKQPDPEMLEPERLRPTLVPVLLRLREYAGDCEQTPDLTLENYLQRILDRLNIPGVDAYVLKNLKAGRCLVMFDGLDEVSDPIMRKKVQDTIKTFILDYRDVSEASYNRFFITSRVADYDQEAFPNYAHFTVAELRSEQIQNFLPRWCRASVRWSHSSIAAIGGHAEQNAAVTEQLCSPERCGGCIDRGDQVGRRFSRYPQSGGGRGREIFKPHS